MLTIFYNFFLRERAIYYEGQLLKFHTFETNHNNFLLMFHEELRKFSN